MAKDYVCNACFEGDHWNCTLSRHCHCNDERDGDDFYFPDFDPYDPESLAFYRSTQCPGENSLTVGGNGGEKDRLQKPKVSAKKYKALSSETKSADAKARGSAKSD